MTHHGMFTCDEDGCMEGFYPDEGVKCECGKWFCANHLWSGDECSSCRARTKVRTGWRLKARAMYYELLGVSKERKAHGK